MHWGFKVRVYWGLVVISFLCFLFGCWSFRTDPGFQMEVPGLPREQLVKRIPVGGELSMRDAEVSGLAWYRDYLVILPQYPERFSYSDDGALFAIHKDKILQFLDGGFTGPIVPRKIAFVAPGLKEAVKGFEGFEAIAFRGDRVFMTIESRPGRKMMSYLVTGSIAPNLDSMLMDTGCLSGRPRAAPSSLSARRWWSPSSCPAALSGCSRSPRWRPGSPCSSC